MSPNRHGCWLSLFIFFYCNLAFFNYVMLPCSMGRFYYCHVRYTCMCNCACSYVNMCTLYAPCSWGYRQLPSGQLPCGQLPSGHLPSDQIKKSGHFLSDKKVHINVILTLVLSQNGSKPSPNSNPNPNPHLTPNPKSFITFHDFISITLIIFWPLSDCPHFHLSTGQLSTGQLSTGQLSTGQLSTGQLSTGQLSTGQLSTGQLSYIHEHEPVYNVLSAHMGLCVFKHAPACTLYTKYMLYSLPTSTGSGQDLLLYFFSYYTWQLHTACNL